MEKYKVHKVPFWIFKIPSIYLILIAHKDEKLSNENWKNIFNNLCFKYPVFTYIYTDRSKNKELFSLPKTLQLGI